MNGTVLEDRHARIMGVVREEAAAARDFLLRLLAFPSLPGREAEAMVFVEQALKDAGCITRRVSFPKEFQADPEYSTPIEGLKYEGRWNLHATTSFGGERRTIFNTHVDVVPPSRGQDRAFEPQVAGNRVIARGACDAKGQVAVLYLLARVMKHLAPHQVRGMDLHIVVEEENGGNGTLGMVRANLRGDEAVVLEPSRLRLLTTVRGAVWFRLRINGRASHSGQAAKGMSALNLAIEAKSVLEGYHADLLEESRCDERFASFANPMPLTFGRLRSGEWPAMTPDEAILEGVMGFLPNRTRDQVILGMKEALLREGSPDLAANHAMSFMYRHDCHAISPEAPLVASLQAAIAQAGLSPELGAMPASCDSWFYSNLMGIPTVVFGAGDLAVAHTVDEHLELGQIEVAAGILAHHLCSA